MKGVRNVGHVQGELEIPVQLHGGVALRADTVRKLDFDPSEAFSSAEFDPRRCREPPICTSRIDYTAKHSLPALSLKEDAKFLDSRAAGSNVE